MRKWFYGLVPLLILSLLPLGKPLHAQDDDGIVLQLALPSYMGDLLSDDVFAAFEADHPGVTVKLVGPKSAGMTFSFGAGQQEIDDELDDMEKRAQTADVLALDSSELNPEVTRAGYFLDLSPLISSDATLDSSNFYSALWQYFQWEGGFWALPVSADAILFFYDPAAFDAAGLSYPDTWQSISDVENAIRTLTQLDAEGKVAKPGFMDQSGNIGLLLLALYNQSLLDNSVLESTPAFVNPDLENLITTWAQMQSDGLFNLPDTQNMDQDAMMELFDAPLQLEHSAFSIGLPSDTPKLPALLPGGRAGLNVNGFAVSSGTQYPELAYELVKYLVNSPEVATAFFNSTPARRDLADAQAGSESSSMVNGATSPELAALLPTALENGISMKEAHFSDYLRMAADHMTQDGVDAQTALQDMEEKALTRLNTASERREAGPIAVETPVPTGTLDSGEIVLNFGISALMSPLPNQDRWDAFIADFAASDPEVGLVNLETGFNSLDEMANQYDCFLSSSNAVPTTDLSLLRSLDPLLANDPTFDPNDMVNGVMQQVQRDGQTWALPLDIQPLVLRYNPDLFAQAGAIAPSDGWTMAEFESALRALQEMDDTQKPFVPRTFNNTHLLMLIAAYGGLPIDYRTTPPTINFTDPATVQAIQQVLDLAKDGYIDYSSLVSLGGVAISIGMGDNSTALYTDTVNGIGGFGGALVMNADGGAPQTVNPLVLFPQGSTYTAAAYSLDAAYISANTSHIDACYRFISALAQRPDLLTAMPARRSMIDSATAQGEDAAAFYQSFAALLQQPNLVTFPTGIDMDSLGSMLFTFWLNRAFDRYVKEDADLETELTDAQTFTSAYQECAAGVAPFDPAVDDYQTYYQHFVDCAVLVDPSVSDYLNQ